MSTLDKAQELQRLHAAPELLLVVNVWDAITAKVVAETPGTTALATAEPRHRRLARLPGRRGDPAATR